MNWAREQGPGCSIEIQLRRSSPIRDRPFRSIHLRCPIAPRIGGHPRLGQQRSYDIRCLVWLFLEKEISSPQDCTVYRG